MSNKQSFDMDFRIQLKEIFLTILLMRPLFILDY